MFAKVVNKVRGRSVTQKHSAVLEQQLERGVVQVHIAPELLRWSDFAAPFPSVAIGGYTRFYETYAISTKPRPFSLLLSQQPDPSPSSEIPPKSLLFNAPPPSCLAMIREGSSESLALNKQNLTLTTNTTQPHSLKKRARRLLRTPSIERDFGLLDTLLLTTPSPTDIRSTCSSSDSQEPSDSNSAEFPITPPTSVEEDGDANALLSTKLFDRLSAALSNESDSSESATRPISATSYCTAKSEI